MEWLLVTLGVVLILTLAGWSLRRLRDDPQAHPPPAPPQPAPPREAEPPRGETLQDLAQALQPAYEASAHPQDLESDPAFQRGAAWLADPGVQLEHVVNYCVGAYA